MRFFPMTRGVLLGRFDEVHLGHHVDQLIRVNLLRGTMTSLAQRSRVHPHAVLVMSQHPRGPKDVVPPEAPADDNLERSRRVPVTEMVDPINVAQAVAETAGRQHALEAQRDEGLDPLRGTLSGRDGIERPVEDASVGSREPDERRAVFLVDGDGSGSGSGSGDIYRLRLRLRLRLRSATLAARSATCARVRRDFSGSLE